MTDDARDEEGGTESLADAYDESSARRTGGAAGGRRGSERRGVLPDSRVERAITLVLLVALAAALVGVVYLAVSPPETTDPYTEFYVLGSDGNASGYPTNLTVGETGEFVVGITNHEHGSERYVVVGRLGDRTVANRSVTVADGRTWEDVVSFTATEPGAFRLLLDLYTGGPRDGDPDQRLRLWVTVRASNGNGTAPADANGTATADASVNAVARSHQGRKIKTPDLTTYRIDGPP